MKKWYYFAFESESIGEFAVTKEAENVQEAKKQAIKTSKQVANDAEYVGRISEIHSEFYDVF